MAATDQVSKQDRHQAKSERRKIRGERRKDRVPGARVKSGGGKESQRAQADVMANGDMKQS